MSEPKKGGRSAVPGVLKVSAQASPAEPPAERWGVIVKWPHPNGSGHVCRFEVEHRSNGDPLPFPCNCGRTILNMVRELQVELVEAKTKITLLEAERAPC
jgi:hypothetical protein